MTAHNLPGANPEDDDELVLVGTPQAGEQAGESSSRENEGEGVEDPHNDDDELEDELEDGDDPDESDESGDDPEPAVVRARNQAARYRRELRETESELERIRGELWTARVEALGLLADPADLPFDPDALEDPAKLRELADELLTRKPHLRSRRIRTRAGQGEGASDGEFSLAGLLRQRA